MDVYSWSPCGDCLCTVTGYIYFKTQAMLNTSAYMSALRLSLHSIRMSLPNDPHTSNYIASSERAHDPRQKKTVGLGKFTNVLQIACVTRLLDGFTSDLH